VAVRTPKPHARKPKTPEPPNAPPALVIEYWPLERLRPYPKNPRKNDAAIPQIVASIKAFGFAVPILATSDGEIVDGHLRWKGALALKLETVPVIVCDGWTEAERRAFRLMVNRSVSWADWDNDALALEFAELKALDFDLTLTGFDAKELVSFMASKNDAEDDVPPVPETPVSRTGDLWNLGPHRLLCGDSTNAADVARLMAGEKAGLLLTDPPYGVRLDTDSSHFQGGSSKSRARRGKGTNYGTPMIGDDKSFDPAFLLAYAESQVIWGWNNFAMSLPRGACLVWIKRNDDAFQSFLGDAEIAWMNKGHSVYCRRDLSNQAITRERSHPTQKPVGLMQWCLGFFDAAKCVIDPFLGSGSTLIACEQSDRICYGLEIAPVYVDVIVLRWQTLTTREATLDGDGRTFAAIARERLNPSESTPAPNTSRPIKGKRRAA